MAPLQCYSDISKIDLQTTIYPIRKKPGKKPFQQNEKYEA